MKANNHNILGDFVHHLDKLNTLGGGTAVTHVSTKETKKYLEISLKTPSLNAENYHIEILDNILQVFTFANLSQGLEKSALFVKRFDIPYYVDADQIEAVFENKELKVYLPYNEKLKAPPKKVHIKQI